VHIHNNLLRNICILIFLTFGKSIAQEVDWAVKIIDSENLDSKDPSNQPEKLLGVPSFYPPEMYEQSKPDQFADGYIIYNNDNKIEQIDLVFSKPAQIANRFCVVGIINPGAITKVLVKLRNNSYIEVYTNKDDPTERKFHSFKSKFPIETVYGVRLVIDHSKINSWNMIKGVGIAKSQEEIKFQPVLFEEGKTFGGRYPVSSGLNTEQCAETNPRMSSDGSRFFFTRDCKDKNRQDIYVAESNGNKWNEAVSIGNSINNFANNYMVSNLFDPRIIYVGGTYKSNGDFLSEGLSTSVESNDGKWNTPSAVEIPPIEGKTIVNYFVTMDNKAIILVAKDKENPSNKDLYVSLYNKYKNSWDTPFNLGPEINSNWGEETPYLCMDGKTLFFSSNGKIGYGGYDIFVSTQLDKSWTKWSKPQNIGPKINTKFDELSFSVSSSGDYGFFSSCSIETKNTFSDIYQSLLPISLIQPSLIAFKAIVTNERTKAAVQAKIKLTEIGSTEEPIELSDDGNGNFIHSLFTGKNYYVDIEAPEHFNKKDTLNFSIDKVNGIMVKKYALTPFLDSGQVSVFNTITFEGKSAQFMPSSFPVLDQLANILNYQIKSIIQIAGHTDNTGIESENVLISVSRAKAVSEYLVSKGVRPWRLKTVGFGSSIPISSNDTEEGRILNRRIEMVILESDFTKRYYKSSTLKARIKKGQLANKYKRKGKLQMPILPVKKQKYIRLRMR
jgi:outer membrane protein OmpA-like peptidoglycan-associated protein